ncbi:T-cell immunoglobulin and mucin domain-containing protein 2-like [Penaeus japonicus]|uniref:T-cell immunoglobulin and mucin domain-containing protein 2-like n=1 Tax=Penaeus japonicus TaxID=27405 RepID=UPI001C70B7BD|nr:T-cell immunoglobulin and mucin domain-containing protein 2-like [Penaeus japonicus]
MPTAPLSLPRNPTNLAKPSTTSTGPSAMTPQATSSDTRRPVTATTPRDPTTCSSPTAACRPSSTSWTATPATWLRSATRARLVTLTPTSLLSLGSTGHPGPYTARKCSVAMYIAKYL